MSNIIHHRYRGPLPNINNTYPAELALPSDVQWLRDNPEAVARVRVFRDDTRREKTVLTMAVRLHNAATPDGFQVGYVDAHPAHLVSEALAAWQATPTIFNANELALNVLTADAEADGGHALTALQYLALPDPSELPDGWRNHFSQQDDAGQTPATHPDQEWQKAEHGPEYKRNTAHVYDITHRFGAQRYADLKLDTDTEWLRDNPERVGRVRVFKRIGAQENTLLLAARVADVDAPDGWRVAHYFADKANLGDKRGAGGDRALAQWRRHPTPANEDAAILSILRRDAKRIGGAAEVIFRLMLLPVALDQYGQAQDVAAAE